MGKQVIVTVTMDVPPDARKRFLADVDASMKIDDAPMPMFRTNLADQPAFIAKLALRRR